MLLILLAIPLIFALIIWFSRSAKIIRMLNLASSVLVLTSSIYLAGSILEKKHLYFFNNMMYIDALSAFIILIIGIVNFATALYSIGYIQKEFEDNVFGFNRVRKFYFQINIFIFAMLLATSANNLGILWVAIEGTTLATAFLINFYNRQSTIEAAWKYVIVCSTGISLALFGTILFYYSSVSFIGEAASALNWTNLLEIAPHLNSDLLRIAFIFIIVGYGTKVGLAPMHTWLPDAHSKAPTPVSALLSGILLSVAMYGVVRFKILVDANMGPSFTSNLLIIFGLFSLLIAAAFILVQKNYKRLLAYSSVEHMGIIALGFGFGGAIGVFGALFHILNHALVKSMMFFNAGNILEKFHSADIADARGVMKLMPVTGPLTVIGALAITGTPPFNIFLSEFMILSGGIKTNLAASSIMLLLLILIFSGFIYNINKVLFSAPDKNAKPGEEDTLGLATISTMAFFVIVLGFYLPEPLKTLLSSATNIINLQ